jgi:hypothetical protein
MSMQRLRRLASQVAFQQANQADYDQRGLQGQKFLCACLPTELSALQCLAST